MGLKLVGVPMDGSGMKVDAFERLARDSGTRLAVLNPTLHNPTLTDLQARGVTFERFEMSGFEARGDTITAPDNYPSKGTGELGAFFYDSEGNLIGIAQPVNQGARRREDDAAA